MLSTILAPVVHLRNFISSMMFTARTKEEVEEIKIEKEKIEEAFTGGPPCLNKIGINRFW